MATVALSEPRVLAHAKRRLFPSTDGSAQPVGSRDGTNGAPGYAVTDTQFAVDEWLPGHHIPDSVRTTLAPFNHVCIGSGYPDLVGVGQLDTTLLAVDRFGDKPPLVAVEAKGYTDAGRVDVERGVIQAYDRLHEANAAYVAAPAAAVSDAARTLARELNVGVLGVEPSGDVAALEVPRIVGNRTADEATAIRFQATAQGVANQSFGLNHPKNYLGYALAFAHPDATEAVLTTHVVGAVDSARSGAAFLGLLDEHPNDERLTPLGEEVVRFGLEQYGTIDAAIRTFNDWKRSARRFCDLAPKWGLLTRRVVWAYPATQLLVTELQTMANDGIDDPSLVDLVEWCHVQHPTFTVELFIRGTEAARSRVLTADGDLHRDALTEGAVYHAPTTFQLKALLYHAGILRERGAEPHRLDPTTDSWALRQPLGR